MLLVRGLPHRRFPVQAADVVCEDGESGRESGAFA